jgi:transposase
MKSSHISTLSHKRDRTALEQRRKKAAQLFAKGRNQVDIARCCGVTPAAVNKWHKTWKRKGVAGLKSRGKPGPKPRLTEAKRTRVRNALLKGPTAFGYATEIWTLERIARVIKKVAGVPHHPGHVWYILQEMGWSCQKPETKAKERDEAAIKYWKEVTWPAIQKRG